MGKIKSKMMRRTSETLMKEDIDFSEDFEKNKKVLGNKMPSKKLRNRIAGLISRMKKQENAKKAELETPKEK